MADRLRRVSVEQPPGRGHDIRGLFRRCTPHPHASLITGLVCGVRVEDVEDVEDPLMQEIRYLDRLDDELAKDQAMDKILRT